MNKEERRIYNREWRKRNLEKLRAYDREWKRQYKLENPKKVKEKRRERYYRERKDPEKVEARKKYMRAYLKKWRKGNETQAKKHREWMRNLPPEKKIVYTLRNRIKNFLVSNPNIKLSERTKSKYRMAEELLGISIPEAKKYIESQFKSEMTWKNHGKWHIDHRVPLFSFDMTDRKEQKKAFHYTNLQPLWARENLSKGSKIS